MSTENLRPPETHPRPGDRPPQGWLARGLEGFWRDLRTSARGLRRSLPFSLAVVATLALCIGANSTVFSVLYGMVLKPLPFADPGQIVEVYNQRPKVGPERLRTSIGQYVDYRDHADLFAHVAFWGGWMFNIGGDTAPERLVGIMATPEFFSVMGVQPVIGQFYTAENGVPGKDHVAVLAQTFWEREFHADPGILGQTIKLSGDPYTVIGVAPRSLEEFSSVAMIYRPYPWRAEMIDPRFRVAQMGSMVARLKPGVAYGSALAQIETLERNFQASGVPADLRERLYQGGFRLGIGQVMALRTSSIRDGLLLLQCGALLVLLLGCVNVASLMLARTNARRAELAVRQALGASRGVLARQLLTEAGLLALLGAGLGLALAFASMRLINAYTDVILFGSAPVAIDGTVLSLTLGLSVLVAVGIGSLPILGIWRNTGLRTEMAARGSSRGGGIQKVSGLLVTAQVSLALILLITAGLLIQSFAKVMAISPGFDARRLIHIRVAYNDAVRGPQNDLDIQARQRLILEKMREIPGVEAVTYSLMGPGYHTPPSTLPVRGGTPEENGALPSAQVMGIAPNFLSTMGIRIIEGRDFTPADIDPKARGAMIVDENFARRYFGKESPVGRVFDFDKNVKTEEATQIVGVAQSARFGGLEGGEGQNDAFAYFPLPFSRGGLSVELRTDRPFGEIMPEFRAKLRQVDSSLPTYQEQSMTMMLDEKSANRRGIMWMLAAFAGLALVLAAVGLYGMLAYDVSQRTKEIGIRGAIGATRGQIMFLIVGQGMRRAGLGLLIGLVASLGFSRYLRTLLYRVDPTDPRIIAGVVGLLLLVSVTACLFPARRAAKVDPMEALRCE